MARRRDKAGAQPRVRPLPLLDTWRQGTWRRYVETAAEALGGDIFTVVHKRTQCITTYLLRFGTGEDGSRCELSMYVYQNAARYQPARTGEIYDLQHVASVTTKQGGLCIGAQYADTQYILFIERSGICTVTVVSRDF